MSMHEIVLPETKPETEWVRGRALQKVSPTYGHGRLQGLLLMALTDWAERGGRGRVAPEWRFRVAPPNAIVRPLVPDVGYLSYDALPADAPFEDVQVPLAPPTVAVEVLSPDDRRRNIESKIATYLSAGTSAVVVVDPRNETIAIHDHDGVRTLCSGDVLVHTVLRGFKLDVAALFARAKRWLRYGCVRTAVQRLRRCVEAAADVAAEVQRHIAVAGGADTFDDSRAPHGVGDCRNIFQRYFDARDLAVVANPARAQTGVVHCLFGAIDLP